MDDYIRVFTDGSFSSTYPTVGGIGILFPDGQYSNISEPFTNHPTNQRAELLAVLRAISIVRNEHKCDLPIHIYSDSRYTIDACTKWMSRWKRNGWQTSAKKDVLNQDILQPLSQCLADVSFYHVRAHTNANDDASINNNKVDKLAKDAIKKYNIAQTNERACSSAHSTNLHTNSTFATTIQQKGI